MKTIIAIAGIALFLCLTVFGTAAEVWKTTSIIYAFVEQQRSIGGDSGTVLTLRPVLTISGSLDPGKGSPIEVRAAISNSSTVGVTAAPNTYVIIVIRKEGAGYIVPPEKLEFMPGSAAIIPVTGNPTPVIEQILGAVQKVGAKKP